MRTRVSDGDQARCLRVCKVGIFVPALGVKAGYEKSISAHMQIPLRTAIELQKIGHQIVLIATKRAGEDVVMPSLMEELPQPRFISESRKRAAIGSHKRTTGYNVKALIAQLNELHSLAKSESLDVLHLIGYERMVRMGALLRLARFPTKIVVSSLGPPGNDRWAPLYRRAGLVACATDFTAQQWNKIGVKTKTVRFGAVRDLRAELSATDITERRRSVVYWRIATEETGGDLVVEVFDRMAVEFPEIDFKLILRPSPNEVSGVDQLAISHENCSVHRFPYPTDSFLPNELYHAICSVFPYRENTVDPQMSIVETLDFGVPCIVSANRSNPELVEEGRTGFVCLDDTADELEEKIRMAIKSESLLHGQSCRSAFSASWSWDRYAKSVAKIYDATATAET